jgi:hypothetical protein
MIIKKINVPPQQLAQHRSKITEILNQFTYSRSLEGAKELTDNLIQYIKGGGNIDDKEIQEVGSYILNETYRYYSRKDFHKVPIVGNNIQVLIKMGFKFDPESTMKFMQDDNTLIENIMANYNNTLTYDFMSRVKGTYNELMHDLLDVKKIKLEFTNKQKESYVADESSNAIVIEALMDDPLIVITKQFTNMIAKHHELSVLKRVIVGGGILDKNVLEHACLSKVDRLNKIKFILDNKVEPTKIAFDNILSDIPPVDKYYAKNNRILKIGDSVRQSINLLTEFGYVVTYDDLKNALKRNVIIDHIERFNIKFDTSYLEICTEIGVYPYKTGDLKPDIKCLELACKKPGNLSNIKKLVNSNKLIPDSACMQGACNNNNNLQTIKYLVSKGGKIDMACLDNIIKVFGNRTVTYVYGEFMKTYVDPSNKTNNTVDKDHDDEDENDLSLCDDNDCMVDNEISDDECEKKKPIKNIVIKNTPDKSNKKAKAVKIVKKIVANQSDDEDEANNMLKPIPDDKTNPVVTTGKVPGVSGTGVSGTGVSGTADQEPGDHDILPVVQTLVSKIPTDFNVTDIVYCNISVALRKLLKLTAKDNALPYIDFRTRMISYLKDADLFENNAIKLREPFLYNGSDTVSFKELNEYIYSLVNPVKDVPEALVPGAKGSVSLNKKSINTKQSDKKSSKILANTENPATVRQEKKITSIMDLNEDDIDDDLDSTDTRMSVHDRRARRAGANSKIKATNSKNQDADQKIKSVKKVTKTSTNMEKKTKPVRKKNAMQDQEQDNDESDGEKKKAKKSNDQDDENMEATNAGKRKSKYNKIIESDDDSDEAIVSEKRKKDTIIKESTKKPQTKKAISVKNQNC